MTITGAQARLGRLTPQEAVRSSLQYLRDLCLWKTPQIIYQLGGSGLQIAYASSARDRCQTRGLAASSLDEAAQNLKVSLGTCAVTAMLPRTQYLIKTLEIPIATSTQARDILRLEVEAHSPAELGDFEISYLQLPSLKQAYDRYEVYIARRRIVEQWLEPARSAGVDWACVVPSAAIWRKMLERMTDSQVIAGEVGSTGGLEVACLTSRETLAVRTVNGEPGHHTHGGEAISSCLRSMVMSGHLQPLTRIGWVGNRNSLDCDGRGGQEALSIDPSSSLQAAVESVTETDFLTTSAQVLSTGRHEAWFRTARIVPERIVQARDRRMLHRNLIAMPILVMMSMLVLFGAFEVMSYRYGAVSAEMAAQIAKISKDGQATQRQAEQLAEVRRARNTQDDLAAVLEALYSATPQGVTYSEVEKDPTGRIRLRGQARSLALPFLLPQELEKTDTIEKVVVRAANQANRDSGKATEFSIDSQIKRAAKK